MAAEDLGDLQAEILQVKHAIRSDTPCPVHGCEAAANRGRDLERRCLESGRDPRIPTHTRTRGHSTDRASAWPPLGSHKSCTRLSLVSARARLSTRTWTGRSSKRFRARRDGSGRASGEGRVPRPGRRPLRPSKIAILDQGTSRGPDTGKVECDNRELKKIKKAPQDAQHNLDSRVPHEDAKRQNQEP